MASFQRTQYRSGDASTVTCAALARRLGCSASSLRRALSLLSTRTRVIPALHDDAEYDLERIYLYDLPPHMHVPLARFIGWPCGEYRELFWLGAEPPRILARARPFDRSGEADIRLLLELMFRKRPIGTVMTRARDATRLALQGMRPIESAVLLLRLAGKRGSSETSWHEVAFGSGIGSVPLAKEVFKAAVTFFLNEYRGATRILAADLRDLISR